MHYFSIHTQTGGHLGFLIMLADDESQARPQSGRFAVKLQSEQPPDDEAAAAALRVLQEHAEPLFWRVEKDRIGLFGHGTGGIGTIRNEYLTLRGVTLLLNDLTGMM